jgi:glycosyltransferase involved in cell wall biosynthesis
MLSVPAAAVARLRDASLVTWQQDLYPETAAALGVIDAHGPLFRFLKALRNRSLRQADRNVVISDAMATCLQREGIPAARVRMIPNWADGEAIRPVEPAHNPLRRKWIGNDAFVVGYSGNMGRAHDLEPLLEAARRLQDRNTSTPIRFLLVGDGIQVRHLAGIIAEKGLKNVAMRPFQPRQGLRHSLGVADLHVVSLRPELEGLAVPSKIFGALAAGRPVLYLGDRGSEIAASLGKAGCGTACAPDDVESMVDTVLTYARSPGRLAAEGHAARALFDERFSRDRALADWREMIDHL